MGPGSGLLLVWGDPDSSEGISFVPLTRDESVGMVLSDDRSDKMPSANLGLLLEFRADISVAVTTPSIESELPRD